MSKKNNETNTTSQIIFINIIELRGKDDQSPFLQKNNMTCYDSSATDATTGMIRTRAAVDREVREQYTVVVVAQDLGRPPQLASRLLTINITDVDDNPPVFVRLPVSPVEFKCHLKKS